MQDINNNVFDDLQVLTCPLSRGWCKAVATACSRVSLGYPMVVLPCLVPYGTFAGWSLWPVKPLWIMVYLVTWFTVFSGC